MEQMINDKQNNTDNFSDKSAVQNINTIVDVITKCTNMKAK